MGFQNDAACSTLILLFTGIDPDSSRDVFISNYYYHAGDDAVAIKSGRDCKGRAFNKPSANIRIENVTVFHTTEPHNCIAIGSENSGGVFNVSVFNVRCLGNVKSGLDIKTGPSRGGPGVHNVRYENIVIGNAKAIGGYHSGSGINIYATYGGKDKSCTDRGPFPAIINNVTFVNITQVAGEQCTTAITLEGSPLQNITQLTLAHVHLRAAEAPGQFNCKHVEGTYSDVDGTTIGVECPGLHPAAEITGS